jgi:hypothetical protein
MQTVAGTCFDRLPRRAIRLAEPALAEQFLDR